MKRNIYLFLVLVILLAPTLAFADDLQIFGEGAILIDSDSSQVLYEKNPHKKLYPASTTKIMTGILAIELGNLNDIVTIDNEVISLTAGSHIALEPGEELTLEQLLNALLIESANDSALAIAKHISGSIDVFVSLMNDKAKELGANNTHFVNPNGLHDDNHVSTAYDLAIIGQYAMKNDIFKSIVRNYTYDIPATNKKNEPRFLKSANRLIYSTRKINVDGTVVPIKYEGATGIKTGFTQKAQNCLVSSVSREEGNLIAVVLNSNSQNIFIDTHKLYNYGFSNFRNEKLGFKNQFIDNFSVKKGTFDVVSGVLKNDISYNINKDKINDIDENIILKENLTAPIKKGDTIASLEYTLEDKVLAKEDIIATTDIGLDPNSVLYKRILSKWYIFIFILLFSSRVHKVLRIRRLRKFRERHTRY